MAQVHEPDPLDLVMFATDRAMRRAGMPGSDLHAHLHLRGRLAVDGFVSALVAVQRMHPATVGRLRYSALTGRPYWRLSGDPAVARRALRVHSVEPATPEQLRRQTQALLGSRIDPVNSPPVQFHLFRGLDAGDVLALRWAHTLMDGRGGLLMLEEIERQYQQQAGIAAGSAASVEGPPTGLDSGGPPASDGLGYAVRRFEGEEYRHIRETARRTCPSGRLDTFIRLAALLALGESLRQERIRDSEHAIQFIHECRESPFREPMCRNLFVTEVGCLAGSLQSDRRTLAARLDALAEASASPAAVARSLSRLRAMSRLPVGLLAEVLRESIVSGNMLGFGRGATRLPSLPLGITRAFTRRMPTFCGAELLAVDGFRRPRPIPGWVLQTTLRERQFSITAVYVKSKAVWAGRLLDNVAAALLE